MPEIAIGRLEAETIRRIASEQVGIELTDHDVSALKTTLDGLLEEIRQIAPSDRAGAEPESGVIVLEWPS